jgi:Beta-L-arabinofuranosidase, GH127 catalytic domain/Beta-L-arabinofuranosidase, GH127 middle domain
MKKSIYLFVLLTILVSCIGKEDNKQKTDTLKTPYIANREPLRKNPYIKLPLGSVKARGWMKEMLIRQKTGATGHLDELYPLVMGEDNGWLGGDGDQWERGPYWIHGLITLAYTLDDEELIRKTTPWIEWTLNSQKANGYFGPDKDYENLPGVQRDNAADWWPRMVVLKVLEQYYSATGDKRVIEFMTNYFKYQLETLPEKPLDNWTFWARFRGGDNLMMVYWLYNITGDKFLLDLADLLHEQTFDFTHKLLETDMIRDLEPIHSVNLVQGIKEPAVYYQQHPDPKYIMAIKKGLADLEEFSGQPQGLFGGDEVLRNNNPVYGTDVCTTVEFMYSLETIMTITGDVQFADHLERVAYNALPSQISDDFIERQYYQQANQVMITRNKFRNFSTIHGGTSLCFGFLTGYPCCTANMHQGWPILTQNAWFSTDEGGLAALIYTPSEVTAKVTDGTEVKIIEETNYPFEDHISFTIEIEKKPSVSFPLELRIPKWTKQAMIKINGETYDTPNGNQVVKIEREWKDGDVLDLDIPAEIIQRRWYERSASVEKGPLVFVLKIGEEWKRVEYDDKVHGGKYFYEVLPTTAWNYGLVDVPSDKLNEVYEVSGKQKMEVYPWNLKNAPLEIKVKARKISGWKLYNETSGPLPYSLPFAQPMGEEEIVTLIPYGCSTLRIAEFPLIGRYSVIQ